MKTIYARLGDLQLGDTLEDGTTLGSIGKAMQAVGVDIQDTTGNLRNMGDVIEELMGKWQSLDTAEKQALAIKLAGKYQYNNLLALLENSKMYNEQLAASESSLGTIDEQQSIYMDSMQAKLQSMQAAFEGFVSSIFNADDLKPFVDALTSIINMVTTVTGSIGSTGMLSGAVFSAGRMLSLPISKALVRSGTKRQNRRLEKDSAAQAEKMLESMGASSLSKDSMSYKAAKNIINVRSTMSDNEFNTARKHIQQIVNLENGWISINNKIEAQTKALVEITKKLHYEIDGTKLELSDIPELFKDAQNGSSSAAAIIEKLNSEMRKSSEILSSKTLSMSGTLDMLRRDYTNLTKNADGTEKASKAFDLFNNQMPKQMGFIRSGMDEISPYMKSTSEYEAFMSSLEQLEKEMPKSLDDFVSGKFDDSLSVAAKSMQALKNIADEFASQMNSGVEDADKLREASNRVLASAQQHAGVVEGMVEELKKARLVDTFTDAAFAAGQLFSVYESIKNIGSIFADDDISNGEKMSQVFENLVFSIPMAVSSLKSVKGALESLGKVKDVLSAISGGLTGTTVAAGGLISKAGTLFNIIKGALGGPVGLAITGLGLAGGIAAGFAAKDQYDKKQHEQHTEELNNKASESRDSLNTVNSAKTSLDNLYDSYKKNGTVTEELQQAVKDYADSLDYAISQEEIRKSTIDDTIESLKNLQIEQDKNKIKNLKDANSNISDDAISNKNETLREKYKDGEFNEITGQYTQGPLDYRYGTSYKDWTNALSDLNGAFGGAADFGDQLQNIIDAALKGTEYEGLLTKTGYSDNITYASAIAVKNLINDKYGPAIEKNKEKLKNYSEDSQEYKAVKALIDFQEQAVSLANNAIDFSGEDDYISNQKEISKSSLSSTLSDLSDTASLSEIISAILSNEDFKTYADVDREAAVSQAYDLIDTYYKGYFDQNDIEHEFYAHGYTGSTNKSYDAYYQTFTSLPSDKFNDDEISELKSKFEESLDIAGIKTGSAEATNLLKKLNDAGVSLDQVVKLFNQYDSSDLIKLLDSSSNARNAVANNDMKVLDEETDSQNKSQRLNDAQEAYGKYLQQEAAKRGQILSDEDAQEQAQNELADVLNSNLSDTQQTGLIYAKINDSSLNLADAVEATATSFRQLSGYSDADNEKLQDAYNSAVSRYAQQQLNGTYDSDMSVIDRANSDIQNLAALYDGSEEGLSQFINSLPDDVDLSSVAEYAKQALEDGFSPDVVIDGISRGIENGKFTIDNVQIYNPDTLQYLQNEADRKYGIQSKIAAGQDEYLTSTQGYSTTTGLAETAQSLYEYGMNLGLTDEQFNQIDWNQSEDTIQKQMQSLVLGIDLTNDSINSFYSSMLSAGMSASEAKDATSKFAKLSGEAADIFQSLVNDGYSADDALKASYRYNSLVGDAAKTLYKTMLDDGKSVSDAYRISHQVASLSSDAQKTLSSAGLLESGNEDLLERFLNVTGGQEGEILKYGAELDTSDLDESISKLENGDYTITFEAELDSTDLTATLDDKSSIQDVFDRIDELANDEDNPRTTYTFDEYAELLSQKPEMSRFFNETEDGWKVNDEAVRRYNEDIEQTKKDVNELQGLNPDMSDVNTSLASFINQSPDSYLVSNFKDQISNNLSLQNGDIGIEEYTANLRDNFFDAFSQIVDKAKDAGQDIQEYLTQSPDAMNAMAAYTSQMSSALTAATKQFQSGNINAKQYASALRNTTQSSLKLQKASLGLTNMTDKEILSMSKSQQEAMGWTASQQKQFKSTQQMIKANDQLSNSYDFISYVSDNFDAMTEVFDNGFHVLDSALDDTGSIQQQYYDTIQGVAQSVAEGFTSSEEYAQKLNNALVAAGQTAIDTSASTEQVTDVLTENMMANPEYTSTVMQAAASSAAESIGSIADSAVSFINTLFDLIGSMSATVTGSVEQTGTTSYPIKVNAGTVNGESAGTATDGSIEVPTFSLAVSGGRTGSYGGTMSSGNAKAVQRAARHDPDAPRVDSSGYTGKGDAAVTYDHNGNMYLYDATEQDYMRDTLNTSVSDLVSGIGSWMNDMGLSAYGNKGNNGLSGGGYQPNYSGGSGSGSGSGGGDGSGSDYEPQSMDEQEDEIDRYERIDTLLKGIANDLDKINAEQDRLNGYAKLDNMSKQVDIMRDQIELQKQRLEIEKAEAQEYREKLGSKYGARFDADGYLANYRDVYYQQLYNLNSLIQQYNAATDEATQEALEEQIDAAKEAYSDMQDLVDKYDTLVSDTIKGTEKDIADLYDKIEDMHIQAFNDAVDTVETLKDLNEKWIDFQEIFSGRKSDNPFREMETSAKKLSFYLNDSTKATADWYDTAISRAKKLRDTQGTTDSQKRFYDDYIAKLQSGALGKTVLDNGGSGYLDMQQSFLVDILSQIREFESTGSSSIFGENSADMYDAAKTIYENAIEEMEDFESEIESLEGSIKDAIDDIGDRLDRRKDQYVAINDAIEHQVNLIKTLRGEEAYDDISSGLQAQISNNGAQVEELKSQIAVWKELLEKQQEGSEAAEDLQDKIKDAQESINSLIEDTASKLVEIYQNAVNKITNNWTKSAAGTDADWVQTQWQLIARNADQYLDDVNKAYNIQKLQSKYQELLDGSNQLDTQRKITAQMNQQLAYLRDKTKLSQYDVDYANAQLEILQKQIALEEAQANKSQMKLRRDSQGNYSYVYTANQDDVRSAQDDLLDADNNAYNLAKKNVASTSEDALSQLLDASQQIQDVYNNLALSAEEKQERVQFIVDKLKEYLQGASEQLSTSQQQMVDMFIKSFEDTAEENKAGMQDVYDKIISGQKDAMDQVDDRWSTSISDWLANLDGFEKQTDSMISDLAKSWDDYRKGVDDALAPVGDSYDDLTSKIKDADAATKSLASTTDEFYASLREDINSIKSASDQLEEYKSQISDLKGEMNAYKAEIDELRNKLTESEREKSDYKSKYEEAIAPHTKGSSGSGSGGSNGSGGFGGTGYSQGDLAFGIAQNIWTYGWSGGWGDNPTRSGKLIDSYGEEFASQVQGLIDQADAEGWLDSLVNYDSDKFSSYSLIGYDTGGYTGDWDDPSGSGRLALLHHKEIVLNEDDTKNILQAVEAIRAMTPILKGGYLSDVSDALEKQIGSAKSMATGDNIEQTVNVSAEFPNATDAEEIRAAILGLKDQAMQYIHRY